jgi:hypothetical protein
LLDCDNLIKDEMKQIIKDSQLTQYLKMNKKTILKKLNLLEQQI